MAGVGVGFGLRGRVSLYSTPAGIRELTSSTILRVRATQRGQCLIASQRDRNPMLKPQRGQWRFGIAGADSVIENAPYNA